MPSALHLHILASGSKGNAALVEGPEGTVLIDCGLSRRELLNRMSSLHLDLNNLKAVFLTHEHSDHTSGIPVFMKHTNVPLFATAGTMAARKSLTNIAFEAIEDEDEITIAGMHIQVFPTSHDVADPIGFKFDTGNDSVGYCTDTGILTQQAQKHLYNARILALEANHDQDMLKRGPYPSFLKARIAGSSGHLSNNQASEALSTLVGESTQTIVAMHLSQENNRPGLAVQALAQSVNAEPDDKLFHRAHTTDGKLSILAAGQDRPLSIW